MLKSCILASTLLATAAGAQELYDCVVDPSQVLEIGSAEDGIIEEVFVSRGDTIEKGQLIARLESEAENSALTYARERSKDMGPIEIAQSRVNLLKAQADRANELGSRNLLADAAVQQAQTEYEVAVLELRQAEVEQRLAQLDQERVEAQLARRVVKSPISGIVISRMMGPGEYVYSQTPVAQVAQLDPLHVEVFLPTELFPRVAEGQMANVFPAEPIGGSYKAEITVVDTVFDAASDTFGVRLALPNPDLALPAGIDCRVEFGGA